MESSSSSHRAARLKYTVQKCGECCVETHSVQIINNSMKRRSLLSWVGVRLSRTPYGASALRLFQAVRIPLAVVSASGAALVQMAGATTGRADGLNFLVVVLGGSFVWLLWRSSLIVEESVTIFHSLGIQMVARSNSGRSQTHFVPIDCITAAVINEAVTPAGCYFYLAILMQGHHRMLLAFQTLKPPLAILVRVRKAINSALVSGAKEKHV